MSILLVFSIALAFVSLSSLISILIQMPEWWTYYIISPWHSIKTSVSIPAYVGFDRMQFSALVDYLGLGFIFVWLRYSSFNRSYAFDADESVATWKGQALLVFVSWILWPGSLYLLLQNLYESSSDRARGWQVGNSGVLFGTVGVADGVAEVPENFTPKSLKDLKESDDDAQEAVDARVRRRRILLYRALLCYFVVVILTVPLTFL